MLPMVEVPKELHLADQASFPVSMRTFANNTYYSMAPDRDCHTLLLAYFPPLQYLNNARQIYFSFRETYYRDDFTYM